MRGMVFGLGVLASAAITPAMAQDAPAAADLLFGSHDWRSVPPGTTLVYSYARVSGLPSERVQSFSDTIRLLVAAASSADARNVEVEMFSGPQRRPAGPFDDVTGNPVLSLFLENHLQALVAALGANPRYLRNTIRAGLREKVSIAPVTATYRDRTVPAWRVETKPFSEDPHRSQMMGLDALTYAFVTSDEVPGQVLSVDIRAVAPDGRTLLQEDLNYVPSDG